MGQAQLYREPVVYLDKDLGFKTPALGHQSHEDQATKTSFIICHAV